ncbi:MAG TPA: hypothetical protein VGJ93_00980 [Desulfuromonadaceae bacterium]|jgi:hypothetical protein
MKKIILLGMLMAGYAAPALAGHGTIRETETQIFVEYSDDAVNDKTEAALNQPDAGAKPPQQAEEKVKDDKQVDPRRQKYESRRAQRAAQRQQELERQKIENNNTVKVGDAVDD